MKTLQNKTLPTDKKWCGNIFTTSILESVSFVTPVLENFFIEVVKSEIKNGINKHDLSTKSRFFLKEESMHSACHNKLNKKLLESYESDFLSKMPMLNTLDFVLKSLIQKGDRNTLLSVVCVLEHFTTIASCCYLKNKNAITFKSDYAQDLFLIHAREELKHKEVAFELWQNLSQNKNIRYQVFFSMGLLVFTYFALSIFYILIKKNDRGIKGFMKSTKDLLKFIFTKIPTILFNAPYKHTFSFLSSKYTL